MQIKFNFNNFIFYGACLPQLAVVAGGCDCTSFRYVPRVALYGNAALGYVHTESGFVFAGCLSLVQASPARVQRWRRGPVV